jgi:putative endonuclease
MWFVYLVQCIDNTYYIGITNNLDKRIEAHNTGGGAKYTRGRRPVKLIKSISVSSKSEALKLEIKWKKMPKSKKATFETQTDE